MTQFNPREHLMQIKNGRGTSDYLEVKWRLVWFREQCPDGTIDTEEVVVDLDREVEAESFVWNAEKRHSEKVIKHAKGYARYKAVVTNGRGGRATATKSENAASFADFIEKAETGAVGRALAMLGYGTQFTGDELAERNRIVDAPVEHQDRSSQSQPVNQERQQAAATTEEPVTQQQISSIQKLCQALKCQVPDMSDLGFVDARKLIATLSAEYKERKAKAASQTEQTQTAAAPAQIPALVDMIAKAKRRVETLDMLWDDVKRDSLKKTVQDAALTVAQAATINITITEYEHKKSARTAKAS